MKGERYQVKMEFKMQKHSCIWYHIRLHYLIQNFKVVEEIFREFINIYLVLVMNPHQRILKLIEYPSTWQF